MKELILGGARSGKSRYAESSALGLLSSKPVDTELYYIATAKPGDEEMSLRISQHQKDRDSRWHLIEEPLKLAPVLSTLDSERHVVLIDCLTLFVTNLLLQDNKDLLEAETSALVNSIRTLSCDVFIVSNEVGSGVVPLGELSRKFVDHCGWLHQSLAKVCDKVSLVVAGLPMTLKSEN